jgi:hypothetical protein
VGSPPLYSFFLKKKDEKLGTGFEMQTFAAIHM